MSKVRGLWDHIWTQSGRSGHSNIQASTQSMAPAFVDKDVFLEIFYFGVISGRSLKFRQHEKTFKNELNIRSLKEKNNYKAKSSKQTRPKAYFFWEHS